MWNHRHVYELLWDGYAPLNQEPHDFGEYVGIMRDANAAASIVETTAGADLYSVDVYIVEFGTPGTQCTTHVFRNADGPPLGDVLISYDAAENGHYDALRVNPAASV